MASEPWLCQSPRYRLIRQEPSDRELVNESILSCGGVRHEFRCSHDLAVAARRALDNADW
jgi:hypothetical protein